MPDWNLLAMISRKGEKLAGLYNDNYVAQEDGKSYLVRYPRRDEMQMDPRPFEEAPLMAALSQSALPVPKFFHEAEDKSYSVYEFIEGDTLDKIHPSGSKLPAHIKDGIAEFYGQLAGLKQDSIPELLASDWPTKGPGLTFFEKILEKAWKIQDEYWLSHKNYYKFLNIPQDPYSGFLAKGAKLKSRPWQLIHADLHRGNIMVRPNGAIVAIDWELALYGDLLYCIAVHLHRSMYDAAERADMAAHIKAALPAAYQEQYDEDLNFYLDYEALKSVITDTVRFPDIVQNKNKKETELYSLAIYYTDNLNRLAPILGNKRAKPEQALDWFREWAV